MGAGAFTITKQNSVKCTRSSSSGVAHTLTYRGKVFKPYGDMERYSLSILIYRIEYIVYVDREGEKKREKETPRK